jgi:hypothetical protein
MSEFRTSPRKLIEDWLVALGDDTSSHKDLIYWQPWHMNTVAIFSSSGTHRVMTYSDMLIIEAGLNRTLRDVIVQSNTPNERLRDCVDFLEDWPEKRSHRASWLAAAYQRDRIWLQHGPVDKHWATYGFHHEPLPSRYRWFSFERKRMLRLLDRAYRIAAERAEEHERAVINDQVAVLPYGYGLVTERDIVPYKPDRPIWYQASTDMLLASAREHDFRLLDSVQWVNWGWDDPFYEAEAERRGTILYLALRMYYNDHSGLPESLDALVKGKYLDRLPVVPTVREPFYYEPAGAEEDLLAAIQSANDPENQWIWKTRRYAAALLEHDYSAPFLWYPLESVQQMDLDPCSAPGWFIDLDFVEQQNRR